MMADNGWACPVCTFINKPSKNYCQICNNPKPSNRERQEQQEAQKASKAKAEQQEAQKASKAKEQEARKIWTCKGCEYIGDSYKCDKCQEVEPKLEEQKQNEPAPEESEYNVKRPGGYRSAIPFNNRITTFSRFFMPMITEAWYLAQGRNVPEEILGFGYEVINNSKMTEVKYNEYVERIQKKLKEIIQIGTTIMGEPVTYNIIKTKWYSQKDRSIGFKVDSSLRHNKWHNRTTPGHIHAFRQALLVGNFERELIRDLGDPNKTTFGGKKTKKTKKVRKHKGITQTGGNAGRLRKGYRYSGKKLKSGLLQIIKCKSKKC